MSILDIYNNPPNNGRQIRFKNGEADKTVSEYQAYQKNDQTSLKNSKLSDTKIFNLGFSDFNGKGTFYSYVDPKNPNISAVNSILQLNSLEIFLCSLNDQV